MRKIPPNLHGIVLLRFVVDTLGFATKVRVIGSTNPDLDKPAAMVCDSFKFEPTMVGGVAVPREMIWIFRRGW